MGCGSSSLKGESPSDLTPAPQPVAMKKVTTAESQFNTVNYEPTADASRARRPVERAPDELEISRPATAEPDTEKPRDYSAMTDGEGKLQPYRTLGDSTDAEQQYPHEKMGSSSAAAPETAGQGRLDAQIPSQPFEGKMSDEAPRKKSFLAKLKD